MSKQSDLVSVAQGAAGDPLYIDATNNRVGINNNSPSASLTVGSPNSSAVSFVTSPVASFGGGIAFDAGAGVNVDLINYRTTSMVFGTGGVERMRISSTGQLILSSGGLTLPDSQEIKSFEAGEITGISTGNNAPSYNTQTQQGLNVYVATVASVSYSHTFNSKPIVLLVQNEGNNNGHGTTLRFWAINDNTTGFDVVASDLNGSGSISVNWIAIEV